jgi:hypothetical protein
MSESGGSTEVERTAAIRRLREAGALWALGGTDGADTIAAAADLLAVGLDGPAVRALASLWRDSDWWQVRAAADAAFDELRVPRPGDDDGETKGLALAHEGRRFLEGAIAARALVAWAHDNVGHYAPEPTEAIVELDDDPSWAGLAEPQAHDMVEPLVRAYLMWIEAGTD